MVLKCELHCHSHHSKGLTMKTECWYTPTQMVEYAKKMGLDCIAMTDHDQITGVEEAVKAGKKCGLTVIPGEEITTAGIDRKRRGHILALGIQERVALGLSVEETVDKIHEQGGIAIAAHPFDISRRGIREKSKLCDAMEVFNAINIERLANWKSNRFAEKNNLVGVTGSDVHTIEMFGYSYTLVDGENNVDSILNAIKKNHLSLHCRYVPTSVISDWAVKRLQMSYDSVEKHINETYFYPKRIVANELLKLVKKSPGRVDYLIKFMGKLGVGGATGYSALKLLFDL